jgi:hypothetical protein
LFHPRLNHNSELAANRALLPAAACSTQHASSNSHGVHVLLLLLLLLLALHPHEP